MHVLGQMFVVYMILATIVVMAALALCAIAARSIYRDAKKFLALAVLAAFLLGGSPLHASSVHVGKKKYIKEVNKILLQYQAEAIAYVIVPDLHKNVAKEQIGLYFTLVNLDIFLVESDLIQFKHKHKTQDQVDTDLLQLSRDIEDKPQPLPLPDEMAPVNPSPQS